MIATCSVGIVDLTLGFRGCLESEDIGREVLLSRVVLAVVGLTFAPRRGDAEVTTIAGPLVLVEVAFKAGAGRTGRACDRGCDVCNVDSLFKTAADVGFGALVPVPGRRGVLPSPE